MDEAEEVAPGPVDEGETSENEVPDWLQESAGEEEIEPLAAREPSKAEETIPESIDEGEPIKADIPDWLQESAVGEEFAPLAEMEPLEAEESELPDWLLEAVEDEDELPEIETEIEPTDSIRTGIPDWLQEAIDEEVPESISKAETPETDIPDWIQEIADQEPSELIASETEDDLLPDTLKAVGTIGAAAGLAALTADDPDAQAEEVADQPGTDLSPDVREFSGDADDTDAAMAWLESLASKQGVSEDELLTSPEARSETPPDWVLQEDIDEPAVTLSEPERVETDEPIEIPPIQEEEIIEQEWSLETVIDDLAEGESSEITSDDLPDWLQDIPEETRVPHTGSLEAEAEVIPDWLQDISAEVPTIAGESEIKPETSPDDEIEDIPDWLQDLAKEQVSELEEELESETPDVPDFEDADAAMAWMESLAAKQGVSEDELLTRPEERSETPPDWVQDMVSTEAEAISEIETTPVEATLAEAEIDEIPEWLSEPIQAVESSGPLSEEEPLETEIREEQIPVLDIPEILQETPSTEMEESEIVVAEEPDTSVETEIAPELEGISSSDDIVAPDFDDADAAMAWLERLAAKQGVSEDELLTKPEERSETPPDWVRDAVLGEGAHEGVKAFTPLEETTQDEEEFLDRVLVAPETDDSAIEMEEISVASEGDEFQPVQDIPAILEETSPDEAEIPDWILDVQETEESVAETEIKPDDEMPELVEVSASEIDSTLAVDDEDFPDFEDGDAAMAWLESLAAQQGVSEDELLTSPEERSELPPDWVKDVIETEAAPELKEKSFQDGDLNDWIAKVPDPVEFGELPTESKIETVSEIGDSPDADAETDFDFEDADAAMAWLESLAAKQGVSEDELLTRPDERRDTPPDWVQQAIDSEKAVVFTSIQETETKPEESEPPEIPVPEVDPDEDVPALTLPEGLSSITPPSWISDGDVPEDEEFSWLQSAVAEEQDKLLDLNKASLIQLERLPGVGFRRAQSITAYRDEHGSFRSFDDLRYVPGMDSDTLALLKSKVFIDVPEFDLGSAEVESAALFEIQVADDSIHEQQLAAQSKLNQGEISEAMSDYGDLIKKGHRLDEIIEDLNLAAEKFPEEIAIVQTLGDAYMQANQLDEALNAYTKAEGLLK